MKIIKILSIIVFVLILLEGLAYINILTSEKYEVDEMETIYRVEGKQLPDNKIEAKKKEIERQKKRTKIEAIVLTTLLMVLLAVLIYNSNRSR